MISCDPVSDDTEARMLRFEQRLVTLLGSLGNARARLVLAAKLEPREHASIAIEEIGKVLVAYDAYTSAREDWRRSLCLRIWFGPTVSSRLGSF
jgi:hypothetical protein